MRQYIFIVFSKNGKRLGTVDFGVRETLPTHSEICKAIKDSFPHGDTYKLQPEQ